MNTPPPISSPGVNDWLSERLAVHAGKTFLSLGGRSYSYGELRAAIDSQYERLRIRGVAPGHIVALVSDYSFDAIALLFALKNNRNIVVPLTSVVTEEIHERLKQLRIDWVCREPRPSGLIEQFSAANAPTHALLQQLIIAGNSGLVLFSSGSTGAPKAMVHNLDLLVDTYRGRRSRDLTLMVFLMFDHIGGLNTLFTAVASGASMVIPESREPEAVCELIARHRVVVLPASPTFLNLILISGAWQRHSLSSLKIITYGTEPMPESLLTRLREVFPKVRFLQTFGTSETGISQTSSMSSSSTLLKLDDPNIEHRIVDGELWLRSHTQILGYLNHTMESFTEDGWFKTGDLAEVAENGYIRIRGRKKEIINVGGQKVLPAEVESVLLEMPEIVDCLVYGEPNMITGQVVCTTVVLAPDVDAAKIRSTVRLYCRQRLDAYKIPVKVTVSSAALFSGRFKKIRSATDSRA